jgi:hypothetical protein
MKLWAIRIVAVALVGLTALGVIGHAINIARHRMPNKPDDGGFHAVGSSIRQRIAAGIGAEPSPGSNCRLAVRNQSRIIRYDYARLERAPSMAVQVMTTCPALAGKQLTYHVVNADGQLLDWDVMSRSSIALKRSVNGRQTLAAATLHLAADAGAQAVWTATLPINLYRYRFSAPQDLRFIIDVMDDHGSLFLRAPSPAAQVTVDYDLPRVRKLYQVVPRLIPAGSLAWLPVVYDFYSPRAKQTIFRLSESFLRKPSRYREDSRRVSLPELRKGDNWHTVWLYADTPAAGVYSVTAGFVNGPHTWYGDIFTADGTTALVINPFLFFLCGFAGIWFLFRFCERVVSSPHWYSKSMYALAAALVFYIVILPTVLSAVGLAAIVTYWFVRKLLHAAPDSYGRVLLISGFAFGLAMELYWGAGILGAYMHAIVLSAALQGVLVFLLCLPFRRRYGVCAGIVAGWFVLWLVVYLTFDIYTRFFGQVPKLDILTYAGQGGALTHEIIGLFRPADWAGIGIWCFFPTAVLTGLYRVRMLSRIRSQADDMPITVGA